MNNNNLQLVDQQFPLPYNAYAAFDAVTLKQLMLQRLNQNSTFTDQIYEGSNFNSFIDVIAYSYNVLLYYLNKTSNESLFANSQIYENMNKIVKVLNYNPIGYQSCILKFEAIASQNLAPGIYTIPKYSYFNINEIRYSFITDSSFVKATTGAEFLGVLSEESYLVQGEWVEYPLYNATGEPFENVTIISRDSSNADVKIDHNGINVYVKNEFGVWEEWTRVESLFLSNGNDKVYECRLNENMRYNIKFGNNVNGKQLKENNQVAIYYLKTNGKLGQVGPNTIDAQKLFVYNTPQYREIFSFVRDPNIRVLAFSEASNINFKNNSASSQPSDPETTDQIRENAPNLFKAQSRLVTTKDFESYIKSYFGNLVSDVKVVNNWEYLDGHMKYLFNIGLKSASEDSRVLYNQVKFADSCNFNDVYIYIVPKLFSSNSLTKESAYLNPTAKQLIINQVSRIKMATMEPVIQDPVYVGVGLGMKKSFNPETDTVEHILNNTKLIIRKSETTYSNDSSLKQKVFEIIRHYFEPGNVTLGMMVNVDTLIQRILDLPGVTNVFTSRKFEDGTETSTEGISFVMFNPVYDQITEDVSTTAQNVKLPYFKIPFIFNPNQLKDNILIAGVNYIDSGIMEY